MRAAALVALALLAGVCLAGLLRLDVGEGSVELSRATNAGSDEVDEGGFQPARPDVRRTDAPAPSESAPTVAEAPDGVDGARLRLVAPRLNRFVEGSLVRAVGDHAARTDPALAHVSTTAARHLDCTLDDEEWIARGRPTMRARLVLSTGWLLFLEWTPIAGEQLELDVAEALARYLRRPRSVMVHTTAPPVVEEADAVPSQVEVRCLDDGSVATQLHPRVSLTSHGRYTARTLPARKDPMRAGPMPIGALVRVRYLRPDGAFGEATRTHDALPYQVELRLGTRVLARVVDEGGRAIEGSTVRLLVPEDPRWSDSELPGPDEHGRVDVRLPRRLPDDGPLVLPRDAELVFEAGRRRSVQRAIPLDPGGVVDLGDVVLVDRPPDVRVVAEKDARFEGARVGRHAAGATVWSDVRSKRDLGGGEWELWLEGPPGEALDGADALLLVDGRNAIGLRREGDAFMAVPSTKLQTFVGTSELSPAPESLRVWLSWRGLELELLAAPPLPAALSAFPVERDVPEEGARLLWVETLAGVTRATVDLGPPNDLPRRIQLARQR